MVKGISKRIVHIKTPPGDLFSEAIFILKEEPCGITEEEILKEAINIAEKSGAKGRKISRRTVLNLLYSILGAALASILWIMI